MSHGPVKLGSPKSTLKIHPRYPQMIMESGIGCYTSSTIVLFADHIQIIQHSKNCEPGTDDRHKIVGTLLRINLHLSSGNLLLSPSKKNLGISRRNLVDHHFSNENIALICLNMP
jgi:hypothetical protein